MKSLPPLYAVIDADVCQRTGHEPLALADAFLAGGATLIQWRAKHLPAADVLDIAKRLVARAGTAARVIVNDRADIAALSGAAGVHLGQDDQPVADARAILAGRAETRHGLRDPENAPTMIETRGEAGAFPLSPRIPEAIVGLSTHSAEQVREALAGEGVEPRAGAPVTYIAVGPVFTTTTKDTGWEPVGLELVAMARQAIGASGVGLVAIGGITLALAPEVLRAGADSVCVVSDLVNGDPRDRVARFVALRTGQP